MANANSLGYAHCADRTVRSYRDRSKLASMSNPPGGISATPDRVAVVGAGMIGLSTAWFLQERGIDVTVIERGRAGAAASWGNAGWLTPALAGPLPEPAVLRYALRTALRPASPIYVPPTAIPHLAGFLLRFARNSTPARWERSMAALAGLNAGALEAFGLLEAGGVTSGTHEADPFLAAYRSEAEAAPLRAEIEAVSRVTGRGEPEYELIDGDRARELVPALSIEVGAAVRIHGQRFIDPTVFVARLRDAVIARGGRIRENTEVTAIEERASGISILDEQYDAVVLATGAWLGERAREWGVRRQVVAGRGYSFMIPAVAGVSAPLYFPAQRVACTPREGGLRVAGMMEFRAADAPLDPRRIRAISDAVRPLLRTDGPGAADLDATTEQWVGSRPCTADGLPIIGRTRSARVFAAGGHGMWGMVFGPVTGRLLAERIATGRPVPELDPFDPRR
ncbi:FAD-dependent oxidoreductase [Microbacterium sp. NPDC056052]|uniref:NAD(P)/FAD-dependent oxidoreductase n=1 Tax=Microbacterium sp. NPDC056052 TaxID=3345695 RepID=UPI0035E16F5B